MKTLLLKSLPSGGVLARVSCAVGFGEEEREAAARAWIATQRDRWWLNAPQYCGDGLVIEAATDFTMVIDGIDIDVTAGRHGLYYATSRHMPGLLATEARIEHMPQAVREAIAELKRAVRSRSGKIAHSPGRAS